MPAVFDASAILAIVFGEPGSDVALRHANGGLISSVNLAEILQKAAAAGLVVEDVEAELARLGLSVVSLDVAHARTVAGLFPLVQGKSISLADRACLALARHTRLPLLTTDGDLSRLEVDIDIRLIRPPARAQARQSGRVSMSRS